MFYNTFKVLFVLYHLLVFIFLSVIGSYIVVGLFEDNSVLDGSKRDLYLLLGGILVFNFVNINMIRRFSTDDDVTNKYMNLMYLLYISSLGFHVYNRYYKEVYDYKYSDHAFYTSCVLVGLISLFKKKKYFERRRLRNNLRDLERNEPVEGERYQV